MYVSIYEIEKHHKDNKNRKLNVGGADERELEEALQRSLKENYKEDGGEAGAPGGVGTVLNKGAAAGPGQEEKKFEAFKGKGVSMADSPGAKGAQQPGDPDMDQLLYE